ncbi:MAG: hypothetical protein RLO80_08135 [Hyphomonas sp.]
MEKFAAPIIAIVSVFLYFTHDAGFRFESAEVEKREAFVERQAQNAAADAHFQVLPLADAVWVSTDQLRARLKLRADGALLAGQHRSEMYAAACEGYLASYLDEHGITLRLEFYRDNGAMAGTISLSPRVCAVTAQRTS